MSERPPAGATFIKLAWCCLLASVIMAALLFPVVGGLGLVSNRASDVVANGSAQLVEGQVPAVTTMVDAAGNPIAWLYLQRRWEVPTNRIADTMKLAIVSIEDKRFAEHNGVDVQGTLTGLAGFIRGDADTRGGSTIEQQYVKNYNLLVNAQTDAEQALFGEPGMPPPQAGWQRSKVVALFATEAAALEAQALLAVQDFFEGCTVVALAPLQDQDWVRLTQSQFAPVDITPDFWIVPTWHEPPAQAQRVIRLDPGLAFGTGTHPTTRMCLRWIARQGSPAALGRVLDYGCGSGILAIGAAKFGAPAIDAVDIDPAAVESTNYNTSANHVEVRAGLPDAAGGEYQTVLANILARPLIELAPLIVRACKPGACLILSGLLEIQADSVEEAYTSQCLPKPRRVLDGEWCALVWE